MIKIQEAVVMKTTTINEIAFVSLSHKDMLELDADFELYLSGKMKWNTFKDKYNISPNDIYLYGDTTTVTSDTISNYLDCADIKETESMRFRKSYICFCGQKHGLDYTKSVLHPTAISSWKCLLTYKQLPNYGVIFNIKPYR